MNLIRSEEGLSTVWVGLTHEGPLCKMTDPANKLEIEWVLGPGPGKTREAPCLFIFYTRFQISKLTSMAVQMPIPSLLDLITRRCLVF